MMVPNWLSPSRKFGKFLVALNLAWFFSCAGGMVELMVLFPFVTNWVAEYRVENRGW